MKVLQVLLAGINLHIFQWEKKPCDKERRETQTLFKSYLARGKKKVQNALKGIKLFVSSLWKHYTGVPRGNGFTVIWFCSRQWPNDGFMHVCRSLANSLEEKSTCRLPERGVILGVFPEIESC